MNLSRRRANARNGARASEAAIDAALREQQATKDAAYIERRDAARVAEATRRRFTATELMYATRVRDSTGWHRVIRVNTKTVTVATAYSWTAAIPVNAVLDFNQPTLPTPTQGETP